MTSVDRYPLTRGKHQVLRVNLLQLLWRDTNGWLLHPMINTQRPSLKVADVATATGLWLCALNQETTPEHELHGFDISSESFVPDALLPKNVYLNVADATLPPLVEFRGSFDVVHVRLLQAIVLGNDPELIISHCMQLLRPGGYLQWEEFDPMAVEVHAQDGVGADNIQKLVDVLQKRVPSSWIEELPQRMQSMGLEIRDVSRKRQPPWHSAAQTCCHCLVFEEYAESFLDVKGPPGAGEIIRKLSTDGLREMAGGSYVRFLFQTVVARKPEIEQ